MGLVIKRFLRSQKSVENSWNSTRFWNTWKRFWRLILIRIFDGSWKKKRRPRLFKRWLALSTGQISIQRIRFGETDCVNHLIEIYPIDSVSQLLNNCGTGPGGLITCRYCEIIYSVSVCTVSRGVIWWRPRIKRWSTSVSHCPVKYVWARLTPSITQPIVKVTRCLSRRRRPGRPRCPWNRSCWCCWYREVVYSFNVSRL